MKIRPLYSFALGVACTALFVLPCTHGLRYHWEREAWEHGAGYFYYPDIVRHPYKSEFRWYF